jgi:vesicle-associated membrane protein 72
MWWQKCRMQILVFIILLVIALVIFLAVCYSGGNNCTGSKHKPPVP